jgi:hypothetical protein
MDESVRLRKAAVLRGLEAAGHFQGEQNREFWESELDRMIAAALDKPRGREVLRRECVRQILFRWVWGLHDELFPRSVRREWQLREIEAVLSCWWYEDEAAAARGERIEMVSRRRLEEFRDALWDGKA